MLKKLLCIFLVYISIFINTFTVFGVETTKYPDYSYEFLGTDKWENFNRKVFNFNLKLNKYAIRPLHILWASIMPQYGMDRIKGISENIEYPARLVSSLIQKDFQNCKNETLRFMTNTILGLGGMFDPAKHLFKIEKSNENMEQALAKCKIKSGGYFVLPVISFTNFRGLVGKGLDMALNPTCYIATPVLAIVKAALTVNRTSFLQPLIKMVESTYADPYEIAKKVFGIDSYIKCTNLDRTDVISQLHKDVKDNIKENKTEKHELDVKKTAPEKKNSDEIVKMEVSSEIVIPDLLYGGTKLDENLGIEDFKLTADIILNGYNAQNPVVDSLRTGLFELPEANKSIWNDISLWNRSFSHRIKSGKINIFEGREDYNYHYLLQKDRQKSPLAIIFPSIGEGVNSGHSVLFAKIFYDAGYSVLILGSHFQWEFVKSMPEGYYPGLPAKDAEMLLTVTSKIIENISLKYNCNFQNKTFIGTSFGALTALFIGAKEHSANTLGNTKFIAICPPVELIYSMKQFDKNSEEWKKSPDEFKQKAALTAAKVVKLYQSKDDINFEINNLPFSEEEGKLITGFVMHQKLSDLIYTIEKAKGSEIYSEINNMGYEDYAKKYLLANSETVDDLSYETSLFAISNYLENSDNYKIYHSLNDYLTNTTQLKKLKQQAKEKITLIDNGAHLGFLYRNEFLQDLIKTIKTDYELKLSAN